jgi:hypothetical protein
METIFCGGFMMKKLRNSMVKILTLAVLIVSLVPAWAESTNVNTVNFPDVPKNAWYFEDLQYILNDSRKIFSGFPDGTFKPNDTLTADMYIKLIVTVMGHKVENGKEYWASTYIQKAIEEGYIIPSVDTILVQGRIEDKYYYYKMPITREDMAQITGRALDKIVEDSEYRDPLAVCELIKDYRSIPVTYKTNVVKCYDLGILTGFPDGEFKPNNILTRAEAVAVIRRLIDRSARKRAELPVFPNPSPTPIPVAELNRPEKKDLGNGVVEVEGVKFDPETDIVNKSTNAMGILKAEEFVGVFLEYLKFYEHNGKVRVRGYIPELPEGYEWAIAIHCNYHDADERGCWGQSLFTRGSWSPEQTLPDPGEIFDMSMYTNKENIKSIYMNFDVRTHYGARGGNFYISLNLKKYSRYDEVGGHSLVEVFDPRGFVEW